MFTVAKLWDGIPAPTAKVGATETKDFGNTALIQSALTCLRNVADVALRDDHQLVVKLRQKNGCLPILGTKQTLLSGALKAFIGVQVKKLKQLGICEDRLQQFGVSAEPPAAFWEHEVPVTCMLREAGIRVMSAKPSSTAVERLWNAFGDNLTGKRRSMKNSSMAEMVYAKMNIHLIDDIAQAPGHQAEFKVCSIGWMRRFRRSSRRGWGVVMSSGRKSSS